jgi:predicted alpha/beta-hydrolase family hydrolase
MQPHVAGLAALGVAATAIDLPLRKAEAAVPVYRLRVDAQAETAAQIIVSGQSYGGRVASLLAAEEGDGFAGLICFSYPLHRPGEPDWDVRSRHWSSIAVPVLFLSGESDPFADIDLLRRAIGERLPSATLVTYPKVGHGLKPVLGEALEQAASFCRALDEPSTTR